MEISVAMCTYNGEKFIEQQLQSILGQTLLPRQIVISDDGSTDSTLSIVREVWAKFLEFRNQDVDLELLIIKNHDSLGVTKNFEQAIAKCSHPLIALADQDDVWVPQKLMTLHSIFEKNPDTLLVFTNSQLVDEFNRPLGLTSFQALGVTRKEKLRMKRGDALGVFLRRNIATGATIMLRKEILPVAAPFPNGWVHDEWLALIASCVGRVFMFDSAVIRYRQHSTNQIGLKKPSIKHQIGRLFFPRTERNLTLLHRAHAMADHKYLSAHFPQIAREKLLHEQARQLYPASRIRRLIPVAREVATGRYWTYGLGLQDVARDLIQPL